MFAIPNVSICFLVLAAEAWQSASAKVDASCGDASVSLLQLGIQVMSNQAYVESKSYPAETLQSDVIETSRFAMVGHNASKIIGGRRSGAMDTMSSVGRGVNSAATFERSGTSSVVGLEGSKVTDESKVEGSGVSNAVHFVASGVSNPGSGIIGSIKSAGNGVSDAARSVGDGINNATQSVQNATQSVQNGVNGAISVGNGISNAAQSVQSGISDATNSVSNAADSVHSLFDKEVHLDGNSKGVINRTIAAIVCIIGFALALAYVFEWCFPHYAIRKNRPPLWVFTMLLISYALLIPSLGQFLLSFQIDATLLGVKYSLTRSTEHPSGCITESAVSLVELLYQSGGYLGCALLILYSMVIPGVKLALLLCGEYHRDSPTPWNVNVSRWCIMLVQAISKWACPDMFAYILLNYLVRKLPERSDHLLGAAKLDIGFTCFSAFCVVSTFSSLFIKPPNAPDGEEGSVWKTGRPVLFRIAGRTGVFPVAVVMLCLFAAFLVHGLVSPCMSLRIDANALVQPNGPLPEFLLPVIAKTRVVESMNDDVSIWRCLRVLAGWAWLDGDGNCILAFVMLGIFAIVLTCCDMLVLTVIALQIADPDRQTGTKDTTWKTSLVSKFLGHMAMLDVCIMGVVVVCQAATAYKSMGVEFNWQKGLFYLLLAECAHYATHAFVVQAADYVEAGEAAAHEVQAATQPVGKSM